MSKASSNVAWRYCVALFLGSFLGSAAFLFLMAYFSGSPVTDSLVSAHGVMIQNGKSELSAQQAFEVQQMLKKGMILTADGLIFSMQSFYGTMITVLVGMLAALGVFSVVYAKWLSRGQVEDLVSERVDHGMRELENKKSFHDIIDSNVKTSLEIEMETFQNTLERLDAVAGSVQRYVQSQSVASSPEEPRRVRRTAVRKAKR